MKVGVEGEDVSDGARLRRPWRTSGREARGCGQVEGLGGWACGGSERRGELGCDWNVPGASTSWGT